MRVREGREGRGEEAGDVLKPLEAAEAAGTHTYVRLEPRCMALLG